MADRPTVHLTNWSSRRLHRGTVYTIMRRPNPRHGQLGAGRVEALTPTIEDLDAVRSGAIGVAEYRRRFSALAEPGLVAGRLAPGQPVATWSDRGRTDWAAVRDGDTLCCGCSRDAAGRGECHRTFAAPFLVCAGWAVVLDGEPFPSLLEAP